MLGADVCANRTSWPAFNENKGSGPVIACDLDGTRYQSTFHVAEFTFQPLTRTAISRALFVSDAFSRLSGADDTDIVAPENEVCPFLIEITGQFVERGCTI